MIDRETIARTFKDPPPLETSRLLLRKLRRDDAADMYQYASDPSVTRYLTWETHETELYTERYLTYILGRYRAGDFYDWAMEYRETGQMIGTCGFTSFCTEANSAEIGFVVNPSFWGRGLATEAVGEVLNFGFRRLGLHRIEARFIEGNDRSKAVMLRCGMQFEGIRKDLMIVKDRYVSVGTCAVIFYDYFKHQHDRR